MSRSGVSPDSQCIPTFEKLKSRHLKYIIYKLSNDSKHIIVDKTSADDGAFLITDSEEEKIAGLVSHLMKEPKQCCYIVWDFEYNLGDDGKRSKIAMVSWIPSIASVKNKMVYASSKEALRLSLNGLAGEVQASDPDEVSYDVLKEKFAKS